MTKDEIADEISRLVSETLGKGAEGIGDIGAEIGPIKLDDTGRILHFSVKIPSWWAVDLTDEELDRIEYGLRDNGKSQTYPSIIQCYMMIREIRRRRREATGPQDAMTWCQKCFNLGHTSVNCTRL